MSNRYEKRKDVEGSLHEDDSIKEADRTWGSPEKGFQLTANTD